jgi:hypothetical protein
MTDTCLLEGCDKPVGKATRGRPQRFCCDAHRKAQSRLNGHENRSDRQSYRTAENADLDPSQPIDIVEATCPFNQEQKHARRRASSSKLRSEPLRQKKTDRCITYKLTDGQQINTGYGRASRPWASFWRLPTEDGLPGLGTSAAPSYRLEPPRRRPLSCTARKIKGSPRTGYAN